MNILTHNEKKQHWNGGGGLNDKSGYGCPNNICNDCMIKFKSVDSYVGNFTYVID